MFAVHRRKSLDVRHRELARTVDHSVHKKHVFGWVDGRNATVGTFEGQTRGGRVSQHLVQRSKAPGRVLIRGRKAYAHFRFELRPGPIAAVRPYRAALFLGRIIGYRELNGARRRFRCLRKGRRSDGERSRSKEKRPPVSESRARKHSVLAIAVDILT